MNCGQKKIFLALIEEASKAICHALTTLILPIVTFLLNIGFVILGILVIAHYSTLVRKEPHFIHQCLPVVDQLGSTYLSDQLCARFWRIM